ncbi:hypothetical protein ASG43_05270 [Aureimonas sp. Leaf454]|nr:hypothetical protein ASG43_05270 [Aureimonas sp. Leaf454]
MSRSADRTLARSRRSVVIGRSTDGLQPLAIAARMIERSSSTIVGLVIVGFVGLNVAMLAELRVEAWNKATSAGDNVLRLLQDELSQAAASYEEAFRIVGTQLTLVADDMRTGAYEEAVIRSVSSLVRPSGDLFLFNESGEISQRSHYFDEREALLNRSFLTAHRTDPSLAIRIGAAFRDPSTGSTMVWMSQRLEGADGRFAGVVAATMNTRRWRALFETYAGGPQSAINLFHRDGTLMMRMPFLPEKIGESFADTHNFRIFASAPEGDFVGLASIDQVERAYRFAHIANTPFILNIAIATDEIYASWRRVAMSSGSVVLVLALMAIVLKRVVGRELRLRRESESRYRALSSLDGLTGVANRRAFDEALQAEWLACESEARPLAVLLLDVDFFKSFNDTYGHQVGDECLRQVAKAVGEAVARSSDLVARYGGEEFVILLRGTDGSGALTVAERVRTAVEACAIPHSGNAGIGRVTISIGVAAALPRPEIAATPGLLVSAADRALYRAKRGGRNRVEQEVDIAAQAPGFGPSDEAERLKAVAFHRNVIANRPSETFDELADLAASALHAPVAMVNLVAADRQVTVGRCGTEIDVLPRDQSFCAHAILGDDVLVVPDASLDPRFAANPLVTGPGTVRFYAGAPILSEQTQQPIGSVCVVDTVARSGISATEQRFLTTLARLAARRMNPGADAGGGERPVAEGAAGLAYRPRPTRIGEGPVSTVKAAAAS